MQILITCASGRIGCYVVKELVNAGVVPDTRTYGDNVQGTFNVLQACADLGIQR